MPTSVMGGWRGLRALPRVDGVLGVGRRARAGECMGRGVGVWAGGRGQVNVWEVVGTEGDLIVERLLDGLMDG